MGPKTALNVSTRVPGWVMEYVYIKLRQSRPRHDKLLAYLCDRGSKWSKSAQRLGGLMEVDGNLDWAKDQFYRLCILDITWISSKRNRTKAPTG